MVDVTTIGIDNTFLENCGGIKSLMCLISSDDFEGSPIKTTESLRNHLPARIFGKVEMIDSTVSDSKNFSISLLNDPRNYSEFKYSLNTYYADPKNREEVNEQNFEENGIYVCQIDKEFYRCRLVEYRLKYETASVFLIDVGCTKFLPITNLFYMDNFFLSGNYIYAFALQCCTPEAQYLDSLNLHSLEEFYVDEIIDVVICSIYEPCLAIVTSTNRHYSRLHPASFIEGLNEESIAMWQKNFTENLPSLRGITVGQYPAAQPILSENWHLTTIAACHSLDNVFLRDISCCIRLSILQEIMNDFYGSDKCRSLMAFPDNVQLMPNLPCVFFNVQSKQYFRMKIVRLSGDRTVVDLVGVDYPNITFKNIERKNLLMLSEKMFISPQCFSVQLVNMDDEIALHHYTVLAKHHLEIGTVVRISIQSRSTIATLQVNDNEDILQKIGLITKGSSNADWHSQPTSALLQNKFVSSFQKNNDVILKKSFLNYLTPANNYLNSNETLSSTENVATYNHSPQKISASVDNLSNKSINSQNKSILKKTKGMAPGIPFNAKEIFIVTVRNCNNIYYRTKELESNYETLQNLMKSFESYTHNLASKFDEVEVGKKLILYCGSTVVDEGDTDLRYERIDDGHQTSYIEEFDNLYDMPYELEAFSLPTIYGPCRLKNNTNIDLNEIDCDNFILNSKLKMYVKQEKYYAVITKNCQLNTENNTDFNKRCYEKAEKNRVIEEIDLFRVDGTHINDIFYNSIKITKEEKIKG